MGEVGYLDSKKRLKRKRLAQQMTNLELGLDADISPDKVNAMISKAIEAQEKADSATKRRRAYASNTSPRKTRTRPSRQSPAARRYRLQQRGGRSTTSSGSRTESRSSSSSKSSSRKTQRQHAHSDVRADTPSSQKRRSDQMDQICTIIACSEAHIYSKNSSLEERKRTKTNSDQLHNSTPSHLVVSSSVDPTWITKQLRPQDHTDAKRNFTAQSNNVRLHVGRKERSIMEKPVELLSSGLKAQKWPMGSTEPVPFPPPWPDKALRQRMYRESAHTDPEGPHRPPCDKVG